MKFRTRACLGLVAAATLVATVALPASADALLLGGKKHVTSRDRVVTAKCQMSVKSTDQVHGTALIHLQGSAQPSSLTGYRDNIFTEVICLVFDGNSSVLYAQIAPSRDGPRVSYYADLTVPLSTSYTLCGEGIVQLRNGDFDASPTVCT
jgi:hypothetical protein